MATQDVNQPCIDISSLPDISVAEMDFRDTSFFQSFAQLPTPDEIKQQFPRLKNGGRYVVKLEHLGLVVKTNHSQFLGLEEAQAMWAIRQAFPAGEIPVPEVFGWRKVGDYTFIYMSLISGPTLREAWPSFTTADKASIQNQLARIVVALRRLSQGPGSPNRFIGSINGGPVTDRLFKTDYEEGPFWSIPSFNDFAGAAATRQRPGPEDIQKNIYRDFFPDTGEIYFTHGDLTLTNIIVSGDPGERRITGIIDWEQAGWYPEYWEYCKLLLAVDYEHEWRTEGWADGVMRPFQDAFDGYGEYHMWRGCP